MENQKETYNIEFKTYFNSVKGVFMLDKLPINTVIVYNGASYKVESCINVECQYYPKNNRLVFKVGEVMITNPIQVKKVLFNAGLNDIREFNVIYMNRCVQQLNYMFKEVYFCSFEKLSIFES